MFHNLTFFDIKDARSLIRSDLGHYERNNFLSIMYTHRLGDAQPPESLTMGIFWKICVSSLRNEVQSRG